MKRPGDGVSQTLGLMASGVQRGGRSDRPPRHVQQNSRLLFR